MTELPLNCRSESDQKARSRATGRILKSGPFLHAPRRQRFLEYIVNETLAGRGERLKGYSIAQEVFDRSDAFDPNVDPIVRVEAARVRDKLREYYEADGRSDPIRIDLPKGSYTPHIEFRQAPTPTSAPEKQVELARSEERPSVVVGAVLVAGVSIGSRGHGGFLLLIGGSPRPSLIYSLPQNARAIQA